MKTIIFITFPLLFYSCSASNGIELSSIKQAECRSEMKITDQEQFTGVSVDNLMVYQENNMVYASMDINAYCNDSINFNVEQESDFIRLKIISDPYLTDDCVCTRNVTATLNNISEGYYRFLVTDPEGITLLAEERAAIILNKED